MLGCPPAVKRRLELTWRRISSDDVLGLTRRNLRLCCWESRIVNTELYLFRGAPSCILSNYGRITGKPTLPPDWVFGPWMSSNEWNTQARVMAEVENTLKHDIPATVIVIEAWSDETTFYIWNDGQGQLLYSCASEEQSVGMELSDI